MSKLAGLEQWGKITKYTGTALVSFTEGGVHEHILLTPPSKKERLCHLKLTDKTQEQTPDQT